MRRQNAGFTLIELMITLLILGIVAAIAVPSYRNYVLRANRTEARAALLGLAAAEEKYYLQCNTYTGTLDSTKDNTCATSGGVAASLKFSSTSERGYYDIAFVGTPDANTWTATATAVGSQPQSKDTKCQVFQLTSAGVKTAKDSSSNANDAECWGK
jgi:type IV pilus assembly protein PilE